jgi:hypothetical protein
VKAYADIMNQMQTDKDDIEEANRLLKVAVKKLKTLSAEKQEDILDRLKVKKRKSGRCARCGKEHPTENCYSKVHADGSTLQPDTASGHKRQNIGRPPYQQSQGYQMHFPPLGGLGNAGRQQPQMVQQQQHVQPMAAGFGMQRGPPSACWNCQQTGHRSFECPTRNQRGPQAQQQPAVPGIAPHVSMDSTASGHATACALDNSKHANEIRRSVRVSVRSFASRGSILFSPLPCACLPLLTFCWNRSASVERHSACVGVNGSVAQSWCALYV